MNISVLYTKMVLLEQGDNTQELVAAGDGGRRRAARGSRSETVGGNITLYAPCGDTLHQHKLRTPFTTLCQHSEA